MIVLALNSGSSSLKFGVYRVTNDTADACLTGQLDTIGDLAERLATADVPMPQAIGHRVVHGGPLLRRHGVIDNSVLHDIEAATPFARRHTPATLAVIMHTREAFPTLPQVACFDTAFHATMPDVARTLPIPKAWRGDGIHRYGFHGLSCESIVFQLTRDLPNGLPDKVLIAHLGHGCSVTAVKAGKSVDTSMGLTPDGGMLMSTRSGDLDPGLVMHLLDECGGNGTRWQTMLEQHSGLAGISGLSGDMRHLHAAAGTDTNARLAILMFCLSAAKQLSAMATALGGVDLIAFSGGIGENDASVRAMICDALAWFGVSLDDDRNMDGQGRISADASACAVHVVPSQEDEQIARHVERLVVAAVD